MPAHKPDLIAEILSLKSARLQKSSILNHRTLVLELYTPLYKKIFLIADTAIKNPSLHLQPNKPLGIKSPHPLGLLLKKIGQGKSIYFKKLKSDQNNMVIEIQQHDTKYFLLFDFSARLAIGLFSHDSLLASLGAAQTFLGNEIIDEHVPHKDLQHNFIHAQHYQSLVEKAEKNLFFIDAINKQKAQIKKLTLLINNIEKDQDRCLRYMATSHDTELLRINFGLIKRGMTSLRVIDYTIDPPTPKDLPLDPSLSPQAFLEKCFLRIKKAKRGLLIIEPRLAAINEQRAALQAELKKNLDQGFVDNNVLAKPFQLEKKTATKRKPYKTFISRDNIKILVGKSASDSDMLTMRIAHGNDFFIHVESYAGAHVIIKNHGGPVPERTLHEACLLAKHFSKAKDHETAVIHYTQVKFVKKPKNAAKGKVIITQDKRLEIEQNNTLLQELLTRQTDT